VAGDPDTLPDAYRSERYLGNIMRYLKCCKADGHPRYPNLKQLFLISRHYVGYAANDPGNSNSTQGCLSPEPFSYELGFGIQKLIVAQIRQAAGIGFDAYAGPVNYEHAPWFDWGPYLWASGDVPRNDGLLWCDDASTSGFCPARQRDFRSGDPNPSDGKPLFGDHTHPSDQGVDKASERILDFLLGSPFTHDWITD
jgi:hypothetical protein